MPALSLLWLVSCLLIVVTAKLIPPRAYGVLPLYTFVARPLVGFFVPRGLLLAKLTQRRNQENEPHIPIWGGSVHALLMYTTYGFLLVEALIPPSELSLRSSKNRRYPWDVDFCDRVNLLGLGFGVAR